MPIDNNVVAMFNVMATTYAGASANTGEGLQGEWPPEGVSDHILIGVTAKADTGKNADGSNYPMIVAQFEYEALPGSDPTADPTKPPLKWKGEQFRLVPNYETVISGTDAKKVSGQKTAARIAEERFKGHCSKILRKAPEACVNPGADLQAIDTLIAQGNRTILQMKIQYREGTRKADAQPGTKPPTYKSEFVQDNISS